MRSESSQILLIVAGVVVTSLFGVFLYREIFPEYKIYQKDYIALEQFRSTYSKEEIPPFQVGVKQIVLEREDKGPATIDRCTSCHVALQIPYFSPTKIGYDLNGNIIRDADGHPLLVPNEDYIWEKLDEKIAELRDESVLAQLKSEGKSREVSRRLDEAARYEALKTARVGEQVYDVTKVLMMHPLMGNETYPFQYHPLEEYGCTSCHNGNGRGLVTDKAHGPVFDGRYEAEELGHTPQFTERDPKNDPKFAQIFNHKPGGELIFQTDPLFIGALIQAKCVQCHQTSDIKVADAENSISNLTLERQEKIQSLTNAYENEMKSLIDLLKIADLVKQEGYDQAVKAIQRQESDYSLPALELEHLASQAKYLQEAVKDQTTGPVAQARVLAKMNQDLVRLLGSETLAQELEEQFELKGEAAIRPFLAQHQSDPRATGVLFTKAEALDLNQDLMRHAQKAQQSFSKSVKDLKLVSALVSDIDELTRDHQRGKELFLSQSCYACHRISGFSRGGIGPELTRAGDNYPWYLKRKLSWPQGDLHDSTMPNMRLDSREIEGVMTFLLAQKGSNKAVSKTAYQAALLSWEAGRKMPWEKPIAPAQMYDLRYSMEVFATQGCAACHRLQGFESNVGFAVEKGSPSSERLIEEKQWFKNLFPEVVHFSHYDEELPGSEIVAAIDQHEKVIDEKIIDGIRDDGILEEISSKHPEVIESFYSPFRFASRAKNDHFQTLLDQESDPAKQAEIKKEWQQWKERVHRVLMMYIQTYGLGRLIGPHLNWSGIYRSNEWLMEHFRNPTSHVPRSIMPVFPFDDTKFFALTHMLDVLGIRNRQAARQAWNHNGFNPKEAYDMLCAQCHGVARVGNGVIAEWIYPIPKNLRNADFLRHLTKDETAYSIQHGIKGTPMPGWGEASQDKGEDILKTGDPAPVLNEIEIEHLVDWMFTSLPGGEVIRESSDVPKWQYSPEDVLKELRGEKGSLDTRPKQGDFGAVFEAANRPSDSGEERYYIKKEYYTSYNIEEGKKFFLLNCAVCHGTEADGSGTRSQAMQEAKPRMLTNLDWINSRDDLRLLRSIKYGVSGTSMTPWGDLTSSLQRLQLVMFIRSLTEEKEERSMLFQGLYQVYDQAQIMIESARIADSKKSEQLEMEASQVSAKRDLMEREVVKGSANPNEVLPLYERSLELEVEIGDLQEKDRLLLELKRKLKAERELYYNNGVSLISKDLPDAVLKNYIELIKLNSRRYSYVDQKLVFHQTAEVDQKIRTLMQTIADAIDAQIIELEKQSKIIEGKIATAQQRELLGSIEAEIRSYKKLKGKLITDTEGALRLAQEQGEIVKNL